MRLGGDVNARNRPGFGLVGLTRLRAPGMEILGMEIFSFPLDDGLFRILDAIRGDFGRGVPPGYGAKVFTGTEWSFCDTWQ